MTLSAGADEAAVGVKLKNAIARVRVARGEKPEFGVDFGRGNTAGSLTIKNGKPSITLGFNARF